MDNIQPDQGRDDHNLGLTPVWIEKIRQLALIILIAVISICMVLFLGWIIWHLIGTLAATGKTAIWSGKGTIFPSDIIGFRHFIGLCLIAGTIALGLWIVKKI